MTKSITVTLDDAAVSAYTQLQSAGLDVNDFVVAAIMNEAHRLRGRAAHAAELRDHERQQVGLDKARDIPHQIDYVRPPR